MSGEKKGIEARLGLMRPIRTELLLCLYYACDGIILGEHVPDVRPSLLRIQSSLLFICHTYLIYSRLFAFVTLTSDPPGLRSFTVTYKSYTSEMSPQSSDQVANICGQATKYHHIRASVEFKARRFRATHVNRTWTFALLSGDFERNFRQIFSIRVKTLSDRNLVASRNIKTEKGSLLVDMGRSRTSLLKFPILQKRP